MQNNDEPDVTFVAIRTISGSGIVSVDHNEGFTVSGGSLLILRPNKAQSIRFDGRDWQFCCFEFLVGNAIRLPCNVVLVCEQRPYEEILCEECATLLGSGDAAARGAASSILAMLLHVWLETIQPHGHNLLHWERIEQVKEYMLAHLNETMSVTELARIADLSERRFRDVFRQQTGLSPKQYLNNLRILHAEEYLLKMPYSIKEIAQRLGYTNQFHFNRAFREVHGKSPSAFRAQSG